MRLNLRYLTLILVAFMLAACSQLPSLSGSNATATPGVPTNFTPAAIGSSPCIGVQDPIAVLPENAPKQFSEPLQVIDPTHTYCAILTTNKGRIVVELYAKIAPQHVNSFVFLAQQGYFDNQTWHRVLPGFVAQTGDPTGTGTGGPGYSIPLETSPAVKYDREGVLGMARSGLPNSAGSQFFITYGPQPALDPYSKQLPDSPGFTIFGQVVEGMDVAKAIRARDPDQNPSYTGDPLVSVRVVDLGSSQ
jgi:peptidylprolyl isomerase